MTNVMNTVVNEVVFLGNGLLSKKFVSSEACYREVKSASIFTKLDLNCTPKVYKATGVECLVEEIIGARSAFDLIYEGKLERSEVMLFVADFVGKTATSVTTNNVSNRLKYQTQFLASLSKFYYYKNELLSLLGASQLAKIENFTEILCEKLTGESGCYTLLHRDIHLSNILISEDGKFYIIDFEQAAFGPLELEFQNSLFYNDEKSLDVGFIVKILREKYALNYSIQNENIFKYAYFVDQLNLALEAVLAEKVKYLAEKFISRNC